MDNVTHTLFALTLARTPFGRGGRGTTAALVLASNAPDIDILATFGGTANYLAWHRGPTHGPLGVVGLGTVVAALVWAWLHVVTGAEEATPPAPFYRLLIVSAVGVTAHILMDLPTSYGTRLLSPFDWHWFAVDWLPIVDVYLLAALAAGLVFGGLSADARIRNVAIALTLMAANYAVRGVAHHEAILLAPRLFGPTFPRPCEPQRLSDALVDAWPLPATTAPTRCVMEVVALPTFLSPFRWRVVAHLSDSYDIEDVDLLNRQFWTAPAPSEALWRRAIRLPNHWTPLATDAAKTRTAQIFLGFSRMPDVQTLPDPTGGATVQWTDVRFLDTPLSARRQTSRLAAPFSVTVRLDADGRIVEEGMGP